MLLELRFWGLRFRFGVRVSGVIDELRRSRARRCGSGAGATRTLQGHLEMGQMDYEIWKWLDTARSSSGSTSFRAPSRIGNPIIRLGFRLFGRREQVRFARRACERMACLVSGR